MPSLSARRPRRFLVLVAAVGASMLAAVPTSASAAPQTPSAVVMDVQTYNLDLGADLTPLFGATDLASLQAAAAQVYADAEASLPVERMQAVARIIAKQRPDVVGLQEVATWQLAPYVSYPYVVGQYSTTYDFLGLLLDDLAALGVRYQAVSSDVTFDSGQAVPIPIPISYTTAARYIDRNVVLVSDALTRQATVGNPQDANYQAAFQVTLLGQIVQVGRGWASIDITQRGRTVRFFDTHLEAYGFTPLKDEFRNQQAAELAQTVSDSPYPTITVGDINARPTMCATWRQPPDPEDANTVAYGILQDAGLSESWPLAHPKAPCDPASWTSGQDSLSGPSSTLTHRIDDVFLSPGFTALQSFVVGDTQAERTQPSGLWPSDHASTVAKIRLDAAPS